VDTLKSELNIIRQELENLDHQAARHEASHSLTREQVGNTVLLTIILSYSTSLLSGPHNCDKTKTRCSAIAERPRCRVRYSICQK